jgi:hypothetical protein
MKNILQLSTAQDIQAWADYFLVVKSPDIAVDPATNLDRAAIVKGLEIYPEATTLYINTVLYLLEVDGTPLNVFVNPQESKNIFPVEIKIPATNENYINLQTLAITSITGLTEGVDYLNPTHCEPISNMSELPGTVYVLPEFEAYRIMAKSSAIDLFALMTNAIITSTKI